MLSEATQGTSPEPAQPAPRTPRPGWLHVADGHFGIWEQVDAARTFASTKWLYVEMVDFLRSRGWTVRQNPRVDRLIRRDYHIGRKGDLQAEMSRGGRHIEVKFFQSVTKADNPAGGVYDFNRFSKMPAAVRLRYLVEVAALLEWVACRRGYWLGGEWDAPTRREDERRPLAFVVRDLQTHLTPVDDPLAYFNSHWTPGRFRRGPDGWPVPEECRDGSRGCVDRDGRPLAPGVVKFYRHYDGRLWRGRVYPAIGGQWYIVAGGLWGTGYATAFHDYAGEVLRRVSSKRKACLERELGKAVASQNYERAIVLRDLMRKDAAAAAEKGCCHGG